MATNTQSDELTASVSLPDGDAKLAPEVEPRDEGRRPSINPVSESWVSLTSFVFAGLTGLGLLVVVFGVYLIRSDLLILIGAATMSLAAMGWVVVALVMIGIIVKRWLTFSGKPDKALWQAKPK